MQLLSTPTGILHNYKNTAGSATLCLAVDCSHTYANKGTDRRLSLTLLNGCTFSCSLPVCVSEGVNKTFASCCKANQYLSFVWSHGTNTERYSDKYVDMWKFHQCCVQLAHLVICNEHLL